MRRCWAKIRRSPNVQVTLVTAIAKVRGLIEPQSVCHDCIAERLELPAARHADHETRVLAAHPRFERQVDACSLSQSQRKVIR